MRTDDFITALAADPIVERGALGRRLRLLLPLAAALAGSVFYAIFGLRAGLFGEPVRAVTLAKLAFTLPLALAGLLAASRLAEPGAPRALRLATLAAPALILAALVGLDLNANGLVDWRGRLFGHTSLVCAPLIVSLSILPLAALIFAMREGAPESPTLAGAIAGLAAAGVGASLYALHCPEDSPLFLATWYSLAVAAMTGAGALSGRWLRW